MPYLVNRQYPVTGGSIWYSWVIVVVPLGSKGSDIPVLKFFMVISVISICGLPLSKYIAFTLLVNEGWFNLVDVVLAAPIFPILGCLVIYF